MKIRNGFVSNSSSSSFILGLDKMPENAEELQKILFKDYESLDYYSESVSTKILANIVYNDIKKPENNVRFLLSKIPEKYKFAAKLRADEHLLRVEMRYDKIDEDIIDAFAELINMFELDEIKKCSKENLFFTTYSDDDMAGAYLRGGALGRITEIWRD